MEVRKRVPTSPKDKPYHKAFEPKDRALKRIFWEATKRQLLAREVTLVCEHTKKVSKRFIRINELLCVVHHITHLHQGSGRVGYSGLQVTRSTLSRVAMAVIFGETGDFPDRIFIVPSGDFLKCFEDGEPTCTLFVPAHEDSFEAASCAHFPWRRYENAWSLFREIARNASASR